MAEMHVSKDQLPAEKLGDYEGRMTQFGDDYYVNFESIPAGMGGAQLFKGLPDDAVSVSTGATSSRVASSSATRTAARR